MLSYFLQKKVRIPIVSNIPLNSGHPFNFVYRQFASWEQLSTLKNCIILFDEIGTAIDSRNFKSDSQVRFTHFFAQLAKGDNTLIYTTQRHRLVDLRVREQVDILIRCRKDISTGQIHQKWYDCREDVEFPLFVDEKIISTPQVFYSAYDRWTRVQTSVNNGI